MFGDVAKVSIRLGLNKCLPRSALPFQSAACQPTCLITRPP